MENCFWIHQCKGAGISCEGCEDYYAIGMEDQSSQREYEDDLNIRWGEYLEAIREFSDGEEDCL